MFEQKLNSIIDHLIITVFPPILLLIVFAFQGCSGKLTKTEAERVQPDDTPPVFISVEPGDGASNTNLNSTLKIVFSKPMDIASITTEVVNGKCDKTIQLSTDNFQTCLPLRDPVSNKKSTIFMITPVKKFEGSKKGIIKQFRLRIIQDAKDKSGNRLKTPFTMTSGFTTLVAREQEGMVLLPGEKFQMGSLLGDDDEHFIHTVTLKSFYISDHEVTAVEYKAFIESVLIPVGSGAYHTFNQPGQDDYPINYVSWRDAQLYINWLNARTALYFRLCSEAEWEYAIRAGSATSYSCGDHESCLNSAAWYRFNNEPYGPKAIKTKDANPWGLHDMHGNLWEWVQDSYHPSYKNAPNNGEARENAKGMSRVIRGGNFYMDPYSLRSANRSFYPERESGPSIGFRLCADE